MITKEKIEELRKRMVRHGELNLGERGDVAVVVLTAGELWQLLEAAEKFIETDPS